MGRGEKNALTLQLPSLSFYWLSQLLQKASTLKEPMGALVPPGPNLEDICLSDSGARLDVPLAKEQTDSRVPRTV